MGSSEINLCFEPGPEAVAAARRALDGLEGRIPDRHLGSLRLLVSELVTNAVRHAGLSEEDEIGLKVTVSARAVGTEITDPGVGFSPSAVDSPRSDHVSGWGLPIVEKASDRWGVRRDGGLTRVWFELDL